MQPGRTANNGGGTMEVVAAPPRCQLLLIVLMAAMLLPGMKVSLLHVQRTVTRTIELQESIGKESGFMCVIFLLKTVDSESDRLGFSLMCSRAIHFSTVNLAATADLSLGMMKSETFSGLPTFTPLPNFAGLPVGRLP
ncbi:hypothetical protein STEG23_015298 [Scotinomys teguina]